MKLSVLFLTIIVLGAANAAFTFQITGCSNPEMQKLLVETKDSIPEITFFDEKSANLSGICNAVSMFELSMNNFRPPMSTARYCDNIDLEKYVMSAIYGVLGNMEEFEKVLNILELEGNNGEIIFLKRKPFDMTESLKF